MPSDTGGFWPVSCASVAIISYCTDGKSETVPAVIFDGQRAKNGTRIPPSYKSIFRPLKPATLLKKFVCTPPTSKVAPLSLENKTNVF